MGESEGSGVDFDICWVCSYIGCRDPTTPAVATIAARPEARDAAMSPLFAEHVELKFKTYNGLFLDLPFEQTYQVGIHLPLLAEACRTGYEAGRDPGQIIRQFLADYFPHSGAEDGLGLLFRFTQFIERQVLLFDSVEDAAFPALHQRGGRGSVDHVVDLADDRGRLGELAAKLREFGVRVVLTAHPTQFYPAQVLGIQNELIAAIRANDLATVRELLDQLGKTPFFNKRKPSPYEEAVGLTWYLENVFYETIADIVRNVSTRLGVPIAEWPNPELLEVGFWPGGDRDGNPYVTPQVTRDVARELRRTALRCYAADLRRLRGKLTFRGVEERIVQAEVSVASTLQGQGERRYRGPAGLLADLGAAREALVSDHGGLFVDKLDDVILKVRIFGFFMASLDVRQDSRVHRRAWSELGERILGRALDLEAADLEERLASILAIDRLPRAEDLSENAARDLLQTLAAIRDIQTENGEKGCHRYVISNCRDAADVLLVHRAACLAWGAPAQVPLDVVPLFESVADLAAAPAAIDRLLRDPAYREHLAGRGLTQTVMVGFSDGTKDGGYLQANWSIFAAKEQISRTADQHGVKIVFFDGRGGPPSRGGGNTHDFYAALGERVHNHRIELTIQGQTISSRFGQPDSCRFNLEQLLTAGLENAVFGHAGQELDDRQRALLQELSHHAHRKYTALKEHPRFLDYLATLTPLRFFGQTNIASRPTSRRGGDLPLDDLRAIPFVGSWGQMKQNVPGFYGVGTALKALQAQGRTEDLLQLHRESLFFRTLLGNSMQSLAKADFALTRHLAQDPEFGEFWSTLHREYEDTVEAIGTVSGGRDLLADDSQLRRSIAMREDIVLPLTTIQQFALLELARTDGSPWGQEDLEKLVVRTMFGIINAARNAA
ncbi:phosphoenolpyruvate carboxylase [bacterium]|nr:phosphoenolpyruvate carboxylase [bacterium]